MLSRILILGVLTLVTGLGATLAVGQPISPSVNKFYPGNRPPLKPSAFVPLPLGAVKPHGWLKDQLTVQANGLTGHLDEFWPSLMESAWLTHTGQHPGLEAFLCRFG